MILSPSAQCSYTIFSLSVTILVSRVLSTVPSLVLQIHLLNWRLLTPSWPRWVRILAQNCKGTRKTTSIFERWTWRFGTVFLLCRIAAPPWIWIGRVERSWLPNVLLVKLYYLLIGTFLFWRGSRWGEVPDQYLSDTKIVAAKVNLTFIFLI